MGKRTSFDAAQLPSHQRLIPDVFNAYNELDREEAVNDMCEIHPLAGTMTIALYTVPTVYAHETRGAEWQKYKTITSVIQGCNAGMQAFTISKQKRVEWISKTAEAAGRGLSGLPVFQNEPPAARRADPSESPENT